MTCTSVLFLESGIVHTNIFFSFLFSCVTRFHVVGLPQSLFWKVEGPLFFPWELQYPGFLTCNDFFLVFFFVARDPCSLTIVTVLPAPVIRMETSTTIPAYVGEAHHLDFFIQNVNPADLSITALDSVGSQIPVKISNSGSGKLDVEFTAPRAGSVSLRVLYGNDLDQQAVIPIVIKVLEKPYCKFTAEALRAVKVARYT